MISRSNGNSAQYFCEEAGGNNRYENRFMGDLKGLFDLLLNPYRSIATSFKIAEIIRCMMGFVLYLVTPEPSGKTGFKQTAHNTIESDVSMRGIAKILFCLFLSISLASMIAKLV